MEFFEYEALNLGARLVLFLGLALSAHFLVSGIRRLTTRAMRARRTGAGRKIPTIASLVSSTLIFALYATALGFGLNELGVPLTTYLASVSIIGIAIAFGSQGIVQDVVNGVTIVLTDLFDVGDMIEIGGQTGIVERLGMRFTVLVNALGAQVFVPNRSIANVIVYPRGYVRCIADVTLAADTETAQRMEEAVRRIVTATGEQFAGILRTEPDYEGIQTTASQRRFLRIKFRVWPGRGGPIETAFKQEAVQALKVIDSNYADWMISITYEVERKSQLLLSGMRG
jgi:small conductance mechanosensitive channel